MIATRRGRRAANLTGVVIVAALMGYALYEQHIVGLEVCPLCVLQRVAMITLGFVFLAAALHSARGAIARVYSALGVLVAAAGAGVPLQRSAHTGALTELSYVQLGGDEGVASIDMGIPVRYSHTAAETVDPRDIDGLVRLLDVALDRIPAGMELRRLP